MIGRLEGKLAEKTPEAVLVDANGVGYDVRIPLSTFLELPDEGKIVRFRVHTYVREDQLQLFGFLSEQERSLFRLFLSVSGVGPRLALALLSGLPVPRVVQAIRQGDLATLRGIPGVGNKTAERILVELRDKVGRLEGVELPTPAGEVEEATVSALVNLGYPRGQAEKAVLVALEQLDDAPAIEDLIREALRAAAR
jgi:Holliday junction DNA helicase RuvA